MSAEQADAFVRLVMESGWVSDMIVVYFHPWSEAPTIFQPQRYRLDNGDFLVGLVQSDETAAVVWVKEFQYGDVHWLEMAIN